MVVHPDGTIISQDGAFVFGIDPATGAKKFSVPLDGQYDMNQVFRAIVAGDGYVYVAWPYRDEWIDSDSRSWEKGHLMLLQMDTGGVFQKFNVYDWTTGYEDWISMWGLSLITNADQGVVLSWSNEEEPDFLTHYHLAIASSDGVNMVAAPQVSGQDSRSVQPVLQLQDGSFAVTAGVVGGSSVMVAFDATGAVRWTVPGYDPKIATADGGVIATDESGAAVMFDMDGNATGQTASLPTLSWAGNSYTYDPLQQIVNAVPYVSTASFWAFEDANEAQTKVASKACTLTSDKNADLSNVTTETIQQIFKDALGNFQWASSNANMHAQFSTPLPRGVLRNDPNFDNTILVDSSQIGAVAAQLSLGLWNVQHALGVITTHEYGHFLLQQGHSATGIMRVGTETGTLAFYRDIGGVLLFTPGQKSIIKTRCLQLNKK
jgi:hypothetical protein